MYFPGEVLHDEDADGAMLLATGLCKHIVPWSKWWGSLRTIVKSIAPCAVAETASRARKKSALSSMHSLEALPQAYPEYMMRQCTLAGASPQHAVQD